MICSLFIRLASCANWAVIFTGSAGYDNYRHSADSFAQYHLLLERNFPQDHIILLNYDNVARSSRNPFQNQIYRDLEHAVDLYPGQEYIDYVGKNVTAAAFYGVLTGNKTLSGGERVLQSTSDDNVFVFYDNHGGAGLLGVPEGNGRYIYADELLAALQDMQQKRMFKYLFFPITACYSASVGQVIGSISNLYIQTASGPKESSYAILYDSALGAYLTSEYSYYKDEYMEANANNGTIGEIYTYALSQMSKSTPYEFGDFSMKDFKISQFIGELPNKVRRNRRVVNKSNAVKETKATLRELDAQLTKEPQSKREVHQQMISKIQMEIKQKSEKKLFTILDGLKKHFPIPNTVNINVWTPEHVRWEHYKQVVEYIKDLLVSPTDAFFEQTLYLSHLTSIYDAQQIIKVIKGMNL